MIINRKQDLLNEIQGFEQNEQYQNINQEKNYSELSESYLSDSTEEIKKLQSKSGSEDFDFFDNESDSDHETKVDRINIDKLVEAIINKKILFNGQIIYQIKYVNNNVYSWITREDLEDFSYDLLTEYELLEKNIVKKKIQQEYSSTNENSQKLPDEDNRKLIKQDFLQKKRLQIAKTRQIQKIIKQRETQDNQIEYRVKFHNYSNQSCIWLPAQYVEDVAPKCIIDFKNKNNTSEDQEVTKYHQKMEKIISKIQDKTIIQIVDKRTTTNGIIEYYTKFSNNGLTNRGVWLCENYVKENAPQIYQDYVNIFNRLDQIEQITDQRTLANGKFQYQVKFKNEIEYCRTWIDQEHINQNLIESYENTFNDTDNRKDLRNFQFQMKKSIQVCKERIFEKVMDFAEASSGVPELFKIKFENLNLRCCRWVPLAVLQEYGLNCYLDYLEQKTEVRKISQVLDQAENDVQNLEFRCISNQKKLFDEEHIFLVDYYSPNLGRIIQYWLRKEYIEQQYPDKLKDFFDLFENQKLIKEIENLRNLNNNSNLSQNEIIDIMKQNFDENEHKLKIAQVISIKKQFILNNDMIVYQLQLKKEPIDNYEKQNIDSYLDYQIQQQQQHQSNIFDSYSNQQFNQQLIIQNDFQSQQQLTIQHNDDMQQPLQYQSSIYDDQQQQSQQQQIQQQLEKQNNDYFQNDQQYKQEEFLLIWVRKQFLQKNFQEQLMKFEENMKNLDIQDLQKSNRRADLRRKLIEKVDNRVIEKVVDKRMWDDGTIEYHCQFYGQDKRSNSWLDQKIVNEKNDKLIKEFEYLQQLVTQFFKTDPNNQQQVQEFASSVKILKILEKQNRGPDIYYYKINYEHLDKNKYHWVAQEFLSQICPEMVSEYEMQFMYRNYNGNYQKLITKMEIEMQRASLNVIELIYNKLIFFNGEQIYHVKYEGLSDRRSKIYFPCKFMELNFSQMVMQFEQEYMKEIQESMLEWKTSQKQFLFQLLKNPKINVNQKIQDQDSDTSDEFSAKQKKKFNVQANINNNNISNNNNVSVNKSIINVNNITNQLNNINHFLVNQSIYNNNIVQKSNSYSIPVKKNPIIDQNNFDFQNNLSKQQLKSSSHKYTPSLDFKFKKLNISKYNKHEPQIQIIEPKNAFYLNKRQIENIVDVRQSIDGINEYLVKFINLSTQLNRWLTRNYLNQAYNQLLEEFEQVYQKKTRKKKFNQEAENFNNLSQNKSQVNDISYHNNNVNSFFLESDSFHIHVPAENQSRAQSLVINNQINKYQNIANKSFPNYQYNEQIIQVLDSKKLSDGQDVYLVEFQQLDNLSQLRQEWLQLDTLLDIGPDYLLQFQEKFDKKIQNLNSDQSMNYPYKIFSVHQLGNGKQFYKVQKGENDQFQWMQREILFQIAPINLQKFDEQYLIPSNITIKPSLNAKTFQQRMDQQLQIQQLESHQQQNDSKEDIINQDTDVNFKEYHSQFDKIINFQQKKDQLEQNIKFKFSQQVDKHSEDTDNLYNNDESDDNYNESDVNSDDNDQDLDSDNNNSQKGFIHDQKDNNTLKSYGNIPKKIQKNKQKKFIRKHITDKEQVIRNVEFAKFFSTIQIIGYNKKKKLFRVLLKNDEGTQERDLIRLLPRYYLIERGLEKKIEEFELENSLKTQQDIIQQMNLDQDIQSPKLTRFRKQMSIHRIKIYIEQCLKNFQNLKIIEIVQQCQQHEFVFYKCLIENNKLPRWLPQELVQLQNQLIIDAFYENIDEYEKISDDSQTISIDSSNDSQQQYKTKKQVSKDGRTLIIKSKNECIDQQQKNTCLNLPKLGQNQQLNITVQKKQMSHYSTLTEQKRVEKFLDKFRLNSLKKSFPQVIIDLQKIKNNDQILYKLIDDEDSDQGILVKKNNKIKIIDDFDEQIPQDQKYTLVHEDEIEIPRVQTKFESSGSIQKLQISLYNNQCQLGQYQIKGEKQLHQVKDISYINISSQPIMIVIWQNSEIQPTFYEVNNPNSIEHFQEIKSFY